MQPMRRRPPSAAIARPFRSLAPSFALGLALACAHPAWGADTAPGSVEAASDRHGVLDLKKEMARFAHERNELHVANEALLNQRSLFIAYSLVMTVLSGWLGLRLLRGSAGAGAVSGRRNATITIRNGVTQQP